MAQRVDVIVRAADVVLNRSGIWGVTISEVAKVSWLPQPVIYQHFSDRAALLSAMSTLRLDSLAGILARPLSNSVRGLPDALDLLVSRVISFVESGPTVGPLVFGGRFGEEDRHSWARLIGVMAQALLALGDGAAIQECEYAAAAFFACLAHGYAQEHRISTTSAEMARICAERFLTRAVSRRAE